MAKKERKTIKRVFGSLINNATAIDGAKFSPWWVGLILFVFGLVLPVVPIFVDAATTNGTSFLASTEYGLGLDKTFGTAISEIPGALSFNNETKEINYVPKGDEGDMIGKYISSSGVCKDQYELRVYYSALVNPQEISDYITSVENMSYVKGTITQSSSPDDNKYIPTTAFFFKNSFYLEIYASNSTEKKAAMGFMSDLNCFDYSNGDLKEFFCGKSFDKNNKDSRMTSYDNLKSFIDVTYKTRKHETMWLGSLIYIGVFAVVNLLMALMIFLMSRGKNNPNNYLNFWHAIKIDWWASLAPGILGLILGFIFKNNAVMIYVLLIAMRIMWLTSKELRPQY